MLSKEKVTLIGAPPSPYTRKMIALLRYRGIPYEIIWGDPGQILDEGGNLCRVRNRKTQTGASSYFHYAR